MVASAGTSKEESSVCHPDERTWVRSSGLSSGDRRQPTRTSLRRLRSPFGGWESGYTWDQAV